MWQKFNYQTGVLTGQNEKATVKFNVTGSAYLNEAATESFQLNGHSRADVMIDPETKRIGFVANDQGNYKISTNGKRVKCISCGAALRAMNAAPEPNKPYRVQTRYRKTFVKIA